MRYPYTWLVFILASVLPAMTLASVVGTGSPASCTPSALQTAVNNGGAISFNCGADPHTISLISEIVVPANTVLSIDGGDLITLDGNHSTRLIRTENGRLTPQGLPDPTGLNLTLRKLTLRRGQTSGPGGAVYGGNFIVLTVEQVDFEDNDGSAGGERGGGAIAVESLSRITVRDSVFRNNRGFNGGAINTLLSSLTVERSRFIGNDSTAGAVGVETSGYGGAIYTDGASDNDGSSQGEIIIRDSVFQDNRGAGQGGAAFLYVYPPDRVQISGSLFIDNQVGANARDSGLGGGLRHGNGELALSDSSFIGNRAGGQGGGLWIGEQSDSVLRNLSFEGNRAGSQGGAIMLASSGDSGLYHLTLTANHADGRGGAISGDVSAATLGNSLLAFNSSNDVLGRFQHCGGTLGNGGGNLQYPGRLAFLADDVDCTASPTVAAPRLAPLGDYGGLTPTRLPAADSPARGLALGINCAASDQRGLARSGSCDAGSVQYQSGEPVPDPDNPVTVDGGEFACDASGLAAALAQSQRVILACPPGTVMQATEPFRVNHDLHLLGNGVVLDGNHNTRLWSLLGGYQQVLEGFELREGSHEDCGGGILNRGGDLRLQQVSLQNHQAPRGGAICQQGGMLQVSDGEIRANLCSGSGDVGCGVYTDGGSLTLQGTTLSQNRAMAGRGGALALRNAATARLRGSQFSDNQAREGGAISSTSSAGLLAIHSSTLALNQATTNGGAIYLNGTSVRIEDSWLRANRAARGGAIIGYGEGDLILRGSTVSASRASTTQFGAGGIDMGSGTILIDNSTLHDNRAYQPGAIYAGNSRITLLHATITDNLASFHMSGVQSSGGMIIRNSLLANAGGNCSGGVDQGGNLQFLSADCGGLPQGDPQLGSLLDNGGATPTRMPGAGSRAVDNGLLSHCELLDQRGFLRPAGACDSGAVERDGIANGVILRDGFE